MILGDAHSQQLLATVVLVKDVIGMLSELFHISSDEHLAKFDEVAVLLVVHLDNTPRIGTAPNLATVGRLNLGVGTDNGERDL